MSEQNLPEVDLDRAFNSLTRDLAGRPGAPGGAAAVATVRRRRRTTLASVAAVAVLAVGAAVLPQLTGGSTPERRTDVATTGEPVVFSGAALTDATHGWTGPWREPVRNDELEDVKFGEPACLDDLPEAGANAEPRRVGQALLLAESSKVGAYVSFAEFRSPDDADPILGIFSSAAVSSACGVTPDHLAVDQTDVRHAHLEAVGTEPAADWWLAVDGARLAMLVVVAPDGGAPAEVQADVATLLERALDADDNFNLSTLRRGPSSGGSSSSGTNGGGDVPMYPTLDRTSIMQATDGWPARISSTGQLSCARQFSLEEMKWQSMSSDDASTSTTHSGFEDEASARAAVDQVATQLDACVPHDWSVTHGVLQGGRTLVAASEQGTLVLVQHGAVVAWATIREPDAPASATQGIASLLHDTLVVGAEARKR